MEIAVKGTGLALLRYSTKQALFQMLPKRQEDMPLVVTSPT